MQPDTAGQHMHPTPHMLMHAAGGAWSHNTLTQLSPLLWTPLQRRMQLVVGMETDRIRMESNSDSTFYHILTRIQIRIRMFLNTNTKRMSRMWIHIRIFTRFGRQHLPIFFIDNYNDEIII